MSSKKNGKTTRAKSPQRRTKRRRPLGWNEAIDAFELYLRARRVAKRTLEDQLLEVKYLREHFGRRRPGGVTLTDLRAYQCELLSGTASRSGKPLSAGTVARVTSSARSFFGFLTDEGHLEQNPAARLDRPKVPQGLPGEVLTPDEVRSLLAAPDLGTAAGLRDRALIEVLYATGLRRAEALALDLTDVDHGRREVTVRRGKGGKSRVVPLTRSAHEHVVAYLERGRPSLGSEHPDSFRALFLTRRGRRLHNVAVLRLLRVHAAKAGLADRRVTPHCLRRSFSTHLLQNGVSLKHIQVLLGHVNLATTSVYLRLDSSELRREILLRHPRERFEL